MSPKNLLRLIVLVAMVAASGVTAWAQSTSQTQATSNGQTQATSSEVKVVSAKVTPNCNALLIDGKTVHVPDQWTLTWHPDQDVKVKIRTAPETGEVTVLQVVSGYPQYWPHWNYWTDVAFKK